MIIKRYVALIFIALHVYSTDALAWSKQGHNLIAEKAFDSLSVKQQRYFDATFNTIDFASDIKRGKNFKASVYSSTHATAHTIKLAASWPDAVRKLTLGQLFKKFSVPVPVTLTSLRHRDTSKWHYHNSPYFSSGVTAETRKSCDFKNKGELRYSLRLLDQTLQGSLSKKQEALVLALFVHMLQDLHQPLHNLTAINKKCSPDLGGNRFCVRKNKRSRCALNLHQLWDRGFGLFRKNSKIKFSPMKSKLKTPKDYTFDPILWSEEAVGYAKPIYELSVSYTDADKRKTAAYRKKMKPIAQKQIQLAIERLTGYLMAHYQSKTKPFKALPINSKL